MNNPFELITTRLDNLERLLLDLKYESKAQVEKQLAEKLLSPEETCKLFNPTISLSTLNRWEHKGLLHKYRIGGRTYYRYTEVMASINTLARYKQ